VAGLLAIAIVAGGCGDAKPTGSERPVGDPVPRNAEQPGDVVLDWMDLHLDLVRRESVSAPVATRVFAYASVALEAAVALAEGREPLDVNGIAYPPPSDGSLNPAVAASAATAEVSRRLFANRNAGASIDALEAHQLSIAADSSDNDGSIDEASIALGREVADAVMERASVDGYDTVERVRPELGSQPWSWRPTPPGFARAREPGWGELVPFVATVADCPVPDPVDYSTATESEFFAEAMAVLEADAQLTEAQIETARYWNDRSGLTFTPSGHWVHIAGTELERDSSLVAGEVAEWLGSLEFAAQLYALVSIAQADTFIANWAVKYDVDLLRPVTYLREQVDPEWLPAIDTPPFPEYPSGHSAGSAASATILSAIIGEQPFTDTTHTALGWPDREFDSFDEAAEQASLSRLYGGIHFPMGLSAGAQQGRCMAEVVLQRLGR
jgi:hypothetical protein